jgi:SAM-dependent methyltransferase
MALSDGGYSRFADYYDFLGWDEFSKEAFRRLRGILRFIHGPTHTVLDLACGTGELAILLAGKGYEVTGVDLSELMLRAAKRKRGRGRVRFVQGDIRRLSLGRKFDLVCCFFDSLNHLTSKSDLLSAFRAARRHLHPGRHFVFDLVTSKGLKTWEGTEIERGEDYVLLTEGELNHAGDRVKIVIEGFIRERGNLYDHFGQIIRERVYPQEVTAGLLARAGFRNVIIESFDKEETIQSAERLLYTVR